ncbi:hypothetical protein FVP33_10360 [Lacisediminihabitans profunda]|uniref:Uncharacterized protein n=1 Tax=Lacisediminihabitans profunda TaxID=2594790 RepID=A0A5C8UQ78_9MICO|nr:hypothetical protein FVP33_10360 [Lacisediminihabitans profunda]
MIEDKAHEGEIHEERVSVDVPVEIRAHDGERRELSKDGQTRDASRRRRKVEHGHASPSTTAMVAIAM